MPIIPQYVIERRRAQIAHMYPLDSSKILDPKAGVEGLGRALDGSLLFGPTRWRPEKRKLTLQVIHTYSQDANPITVEFSESHISCSCRQKKNQVGSVNCPHVIFCLVRAFQTRPKMQQS